MSFLAPLAISGISALAGGLANKAKTSTATSTPTLQGGQQALYNQLLTQQAGMMGGPSLGGYQASSEDDINHMAQLQQKNLQETLAARGITGPAANYAAGRVDNSRFAQISKLRQSLPLLQQQFGTDAINAGSNLVRAVAPGNTSTQTTPGQGAAGAIGNGASTLAYFLGHGAFGGGDGSQPSNAQMPPLG